MKQNIIKFISGFALVVVIVFSFSSCNDFLDRKPQGNSTLEEATIQSRVFYLYGMMRNYNITAGIPAFAIHMFRSEDSEAGSTENDSKAVATVFDNFNYSPDNGTANAYWETNFKIVVLCGQILADIEALSQGEQAATDMKRNKAETHFFRAFAYFNLVRAFGEIPLIDFAVQTAKDANLPKVSVERIYELIDADLSVAEELPKRWNAEFEGRLTWGAARSLHARTYMMRNDWTNMYNAATDVIGEGIYNLNINPALPSDPNNVNNVFMVEGEWSNESVFEIGCSSTAAMPGTAKIGSQFSQVQGVRGSNWGAKPTDPAEIEEGKFGDWNLGWGWHMATKLIGRAYQEDGLGGAFEDGDPRRDATLLYFRRMTTSKNAAGEEEVFIPKITDANTNKPWGESPISEAMGEYFNKKAYTDPELRKKYNNSGYWTNIRLIRYSDVLLMGAEAANELGKIGEAEGYLEQVRERARKSADIGVDQSTILPKRTGSQDKMRTYIRNERRAELALEWDRFYDLVRWGEATRVLKAAGKNYQEKNKYLPIPQTQIDKSNGVLIQNPDYVIK